MPLEQSTDTSFVVCETQDGPGTNNRAGEETTSLQLQRSLTEAAKALQGLPSHENDIQSQLEQLRTKSSSIEDEKAAMQAASQDGESNSHKHMQDALAKQHASFDDPLAT